MEVKQSVATCRMKKVKKKLNIQRQSIKGQKKNLSELTTLNNNCNLKYKMIRQWINTKNPKDQQNSLKRKACEARFFG